MFGNALTGEAQLKNVLFPKLVALNSINFDYSECCFSDKLMNCKDKKDGLSREGCGRVAMYKATGNPHCYTLECNYASGKLKNTLTSKIVKATGAVDPETDPVTDSSSAIYSDK
jgi:cytosolic carboxypeptidase protein 5